MIRGFPPRLKLSFFFIMMVALAIGTPHLFDGHLFINKKYAQSAVIFFDFALSFFLSYHYLRDLNKIKKEKNYSEKLLSKSYKRLGVTNRKIGILKDFISTMADESIDPRKIIMSLTEYLVYSITKSSNGVLRFIDRSNSRTITEWNIMGKGQEVFKISNRKIIEGEESGILNGNFQYLRSRLAHTRVECAFIFDSDCSDFDSSFLMILLIQIHSLGIVQKQIPHIKEAEPSSPWELN